MTANIFGQHCCVRISFLFFISKQKVPIRQKEPGRTQTAIMLDLTTWGSWMETLGT